MRLLLSSYFKKINSFTLKADLISSHQKEILVNLYL
jgi:hypothetical protein